MSQIYLVVTGHYSSFSVDAAFSTRRKAKLYADKLNKHDVDADARLRLFDIDTPPEEWFYTSVRMTKEGNTLETWVSKASHYWEKNDYIFDFDGNIVVFVKTEDEKTAIKAANERRTQLLALNQWGINPNSKPKGKGDK